MLPTRSLYQSALAEAETAVADLREAYAKNTLELLHIPERRDDLDAAADAAAKLSQNTSDICILGIGGSSLGGQALAELIPFGAAKKPRVHFFANPDPITFDAALSIARTEIDALRLYLQIRRHGRNADADARRRRRNRESGRRKISQAAFPLHHGSKAESVAQIRRKHRCAHARTSLRRRRALFGVDGRGIVARAADGPRRARDPRRCRTPRCSKC